MLIRPECGDAVTRIRGQVASRTVGWTTALRALHQPYLHASLLVMNDDAVAAGIAKVSLVEKANAAAIASRSDCKHVHSTLLTMKGCLLLQHAEHSL